MRKDEKTHSKLNCDQTNESCFKIGGTNFVGPVHGEGELICPMGKDEKKIIASIIVTKRMEEVWGAVHGGGG